MTPATATARQRVRNNPLETAIVLTVVGYSLVIGTFVLDLPIYPELSNAQVNVFSSVIAVINGTTTVFLAAGWYYIRAGDVEKHRYAMVTAFALILLFLVVYLIRVGGGGTKQFVGPDLVTYAYLAMLAIHILLSILAVPLVLYALLLGLTHTPAELRETAHARVGRFAAGSWLLSLILGVVTYLMLDHIYAYEFAWIVVV
ncbi:DUF420 domain-containing protein [Halobacteria archaeon AArc-curdl1]|uniref:DUF420 domain-containing protein n=1 Tax=Natronosalvus hydrolyticus TaxID=2979988 RepID=A0AAP2Z4F2_9EURY|nr:DUF420 domain-containing protein [Halobacteria archaeon AArc-curdl1]